ncbi:MAG: GNAT family N-acetyltransferase [Planctomycetaceae bacterium]
MTKHFSPDFAPFVPENLPIYVPSNQQKEAALQLLASVFPIAERSAQLSRYAQWLDLPASPGFSLLATGPANQPPSASLLYQILPGNVALLWPPGIAENAPWQTSVASLLQFTHHQLTSAGIQLSQFLLPDLGEQIAYQESLISTLKTAGYHSLARLLYLYVSDQESPFPTSAPTPKNCSLLPASQFTTPQLHDLIEQTYIDTQDCPAMNGLRSTDQVLAGYRSAGTCEDRYWFVATDQNQKPIACLLLAPDTNNHSCELVYVGVIPEARGRGVAGDLVSWAKWQAKSAACSQLLLAVDDQNLPGLKLYQRHGFQSFDAREVYIHSLSPQTGS